MSDRAEKLLCVGECGSERVSCVLSVQNFRCLVNYLSVTCNILGYVEGSVETPQTVSVCWTMEDRWPASLLYCGTLAYGVYKNSKRKYILQQGN